MDSRLLILFVNKDFTLAFLLDPTPEHSFCAKRHGNMALPVEGNNPAVAAEPGQFFHDHAVGGLLHGETGILLEGRDVVSDGEPDKKLSPSGRRHSAGCIVGIRAGANDWRISH